MKKHLIIIGKENTGKSCLAMHIASHYGRDNVFRIDGYLCAKELELELKEAITSKRLLFVIDGCSVSKLHTVIMPHVFMERENAFGGARVIITVEHSFSENKVSCDNFYPSRAFEIIEVSDIQYHYVKPDERHLYTSKYFE